MAHERMFDPDDALLARVRRIALAMPDGKEKVSHGRPAFFTRNIFVTYGASIKVDATWEQHPHAVVVKPDANERIALLDMGIAWVPGYWGPWGWVAIDLDNSTDWDEVAEWIDMSCRGTAPPPLVAQLDDPASISD